MTRFAVFALIAGCLASAYPAAAQEPASAAMSLDDAVAYALAHHPDIAVASAGTLSAQGAAQIARSAALPSVNVSASRIRAQDEPAGFQGASTTIGAQQLIFDLGRTPNSIASARAALQAARSAQEDAKLRVARTVTDAYYLLLQAVGVADANRAALASRQADRDAAQARLNAGSAARFDVLRADTALAQSRQALTAAEAQIRTARSRLNVSMGRPADAPVEAAEPAPLPPPGGPDLVNRALDARPDVRASRQQVESARRGLSATRVGNAPALSASGEYNGVKRTFPADSLRWSAGLTVSWAAFDGFRNAGEVKSARAAVQRAEADLRLVELAATQEVTDAVTALETAEEQVRLGEATVAQATEARDVAVGRYQAGAGSQLEVSDAESQLQAATVDLVNAKYDLARTRRDLWYIIGTTPGTGSQAPAR